MVWKQARINHGILILIELWRKTKQWERNLENVNFVPKDVQRIYHHINFRKCTIIKKRSIKKFSYTGKQLCWSLFFIKMQRSRPAILLKRDSNTDVFLKIFKKIFQEQLFWRTSVMVSFYVSYKEVKKTFSQKQNKKIPF